MTDKQPVPNIVIVCSICDKESPFDGCDAVGCTWRTEVVLNAIRDGALMNVVCDESNNSEEDTALGRLNVTVSAYRTTEGSA
jgi:hypothetical protein